MKTRIALAVVAAILAVLGLAMLAIGFGLAPMRESSGSAPTSSQQLASTSPTSQKAWEAGPIVAAFSTVGCADSCYNIVFSFPPTMVLYADGRQIVSSKTHFYQRQLTHDDVCALLGAIDRTGFFEFSSQEYQEAYGQLKPQMHDTEFLGVYGWKSNSMTLADFTALLDGYRTGEMQIPPALETTYHLLMDYDAGKMTVYQPEKIAVYIRKQTLEGYGPYQPPEWQVASLPLSKLAQRYAEEVGSTYPEGEIVLTGSDAATLYAAYEQRAWSGIDVYEESGQYYGLAVRALLPYEETGGSVYGATQIIERNASYPSVRMACTL